MVRLMMVAAPGPIVGFVSPPLAATELRGGSEKKGAGSTCNQDQHGASHSSRKVPVLAAFCQNVHAIIVVRQHRQAAEAHCLLSVTDGLGRKGRLTGAPSKSLYW